MPLMNANWDLQRGRNRRPAGGGTAVAPPPAPTAADPMTRAGLSQYIEQGLGQYGAKAKSLEAEEEGRGASMEKYLRDASAAADKPTITEDDIRRRFAARADEAGSGFADKMAGLRDYMGASGVTQGGFVSGVASNAELSRLGQLTQARGDLMAFKATQDALDRQRSFDRAQTVAAAINRPVSMLGVDFENQQLQTRLAQLGIQSNLEGSQAMANAQKKSSKDAKTGGLLGSAMQLGGAAFGV